MFLAAETKSFEAGITLIVKKQRTRADFDFVFAIADGGLAVEVQTNFNAVGVKRARPIEIVRGMKFVPLEAETEFAKTAEHLPPTGANRSPRRLFDEKPRIDLRFATKLLQ